MLLGGEAELIESTCCFAIEDSTAGAKDEREGGDGGDAVIPRQQFLCSVEGAHFFNVLSALSCEGSEEVDFVIHSSGEFEETHRAGG